MNTIEAIKTIEANAVAFAKACRSNRPTLSTFEDVCEYCDVEAADTLGGSEAARIFVEAFEAA